MQIEDYAVEPAELRVDRHRSDMVHSSGVARHCHPILILR
jgi:hypothetical protein